ncbi:DNA-formamidopyrimidine glycosylase [Vulcanibacillus modesticaldus]|uniref:Formamidopyrimidine-DNA glycosylase n=1 Tax=Vulcanibacillus modesticaldus TaxID=337097 RepID=A0A1D2YWH2_9BACI|nr:DNA-formamidopyrimidine glycosylase [Vulcanibacillus modesticaldus]OEG00095.1 DNA-formamidopyrimidine glycosylase [Vulcanibacillus modesticaldus]
MPELPEVETVRRALLKQIIGKTITKVDVFYPRIIRHPHDIEEFKMLLKGQTLHKIDRRGKYLLFRFDQVTLVSHLRMEGKYLYKAEKSVSLDKHVHVVFYFNDGSELQYHDVRKFGTMELVFKGEEEKLASLKKLGQEPIDPLFDQELFKRKVQKRNIAIKKILLDQTIISGLGNIYVDDTLAMSKIHPLRLGTSLTDEEIARITNSMIEVLNKAIEKGGSSIRTFESLHGKGSMQDHLIVYGRTNLPCHYCGTPIEKIKVGGRGTHYCPTCQK